MFYKNIANIPIFLLILLFFQPFYNAQNSDLVLSAGNYAYLYVPLKISAKGLLSFCTWLQLEGTDFDYFLSNNPAEFKTTLKGAVRFDNELIEGSADGSYTYATDCNAKKADWFHICLTRDQSSINFYFNGFPLQNYTLRDKLDEDNSDKIEVKIGDIYGKGGTNNYYQSNVYNRVITEKEAMDLSNCESIPGDLISWADITGKSPNIEFDPATNLVQKPVPCPNPPKVQRIDCKTGEPIKEPGSDPTSSSGNTSTSSGNSNQDPGSSSGNPSSSMGNSDQISGSSSGNPSSSMGNSNQDPGSSSGNPSSSMGNSDQSSGSGGSGNPTSPSPNSGTSSQNQNSGSNPASSGN